MAVRSRLRRGGALALLAVVVVLCGRGLGLLPWGDGSAGGSAGDAGGDGAPAPTTAAVVAPVPPLPLPPDATAATVPAEAPIAAATPAVPAAEGVADAAPVPPTNGNEAEAAFDDRAGARAAIVQSMLASGRIASAFAAIAQIEAGGGATVARLRQQADRAFTVGCTTLVEQLARGAWLEASASLQQLCTPPDAVVLERLAAFCRERGLPPLGSADPLPVADTAVRALADGLHLLDRAVQLSPPGARAVEDDAVMPALVRARVVAERERAVTVRLVDRDGVTFPTVPIHTVEPLAITAPEAAAMAAAAWSAGDGRAARLWAAVVQLRGGALPPVLAALAGGR